MGETTAEEKPRAVNILEKEMAATETQAMLVKAEYQRLGSLLEKMNKPNEPAASSGASKQEPLEEMGAPKEPAAASGASNQESKPSVQDGAKVVLVPWQCTEHKKLMGFKLAGPE